MAQLDLNNPYQQEVVGLDRQRQLAQMLINQGFQQPQGQMVSGRFVAPAWTERLAGLLSIYAGQKGLEEADKKQLDLAAALRKRYGEEVKEFRNLMQGQEGTPEKAVEMAGPFGEGVGLNNRDIPMPIAYTPARAAVAPNPQAAYDFAASAYNPALQAVGMKNLTPEAVTLSEGQKRFITMPDGSLREVGSGGEKMSETQRNYLQAQKEGYQGTFFDYQRDLKKAGATSINMPSEGERKAGFMANILDKNIAQMQAALGVDPSAVKPNVPASIVAAIAGENVLSRAITPAQRQIIEDSQLDVLDAALTLRTGAAYTREQLLGMRGTYFPRIGDSPETVKAKQNRLETLLSSAYIAAGRATPPRLSETPPPAPARPTAQQLNVPKIGEAKAPKGVDQAVWNVMTPQEKALWK